MLISHLIHTADILTRVTAQWQPRLLMTRLHQIDVPSTDKILTEYIDEQPLHAQRYLVGTTQIVGRKIKWKIIVGWRTRVYRRQRLCFTHTHTHACMTMIKVFSETPDDIINVRIKRIRYRRHEYEIKPRSVWTHIDYDDLTIKRTKKKNEIFIITFAGGNWKINVLRSEFRLRCTNP